MPSTPHVEKHFMAGEKVRDVVIGMSDGLTVPFALAAGLSGAVASSKIVVTAGLAEIAAGAIAMGLGGFLAARSDEEHYASEEAREYREIRDLRDKAIAVDGKRWVDFMMRFELGLDRPDPKRAPISAATIAASYIVGGLIPLSPYFFAGSIAEALTWSVGLTGVALVVFGAIKGRLTGAGMVKSS